MATEMKVVLLLLCAIIVGAKASKRLESDFRPCAKWRKYPIVVKDVEIDPEPAVRGGVVTFTVPAFTDLEIQGGTVIVSVSLYGFKVHSERDDLCEMTTCPIKGDFTLSSSQQIPRLTPPGAYKLKFQVLDSNGIEKACASGGFAVVWKANHNLLLGTSASVAQDLSVLEVGSV